MHQILNNTARNNHLAKCLFDCIEDKNIQAIKKLLDDNGANPNIIIPDRGISPFHLAIGSWEENVAEEITKLFLGYGGDPNVRSDENQTPVHIAAAWGRLNVLNILLNCGGDPTLEDDNGKTAVDYAKIENYPMIAEKLQNFIQELNSDTKLNDKNYDFILNKIIINNGSVIAEYETSLENNCEIEKLPKTDSFVNNWCSEHAKVLENNENLTTILINDEEDNSITYISSDESIQRCYSNISGVLPINSSQSELNLDQSEKFETSSAEYITCNSVNEFEKNIIDSLITLDLSDEKSLDITSDRSANNFCRITTVDKPNINIEQEYIYTDNEEGIVLIEKRILVNQKIDENQSDSSKLSSLPSVINYDTDTLRNELTNLGEAPGPITKTTKRVYLKRLERLKKYTFLQPSTTKNDNRVYSVELEKTLRDPNWTKDLTSYKALELAISNQFSKPEPSKRWREGYIKASFTYLLLDPRITQNLPTKSCEISLEDTWKIFLSAIFYVGKGKRSRPYSHLYAAVNFWKNGQKSHETNKKIDYILDIWKNNFGVICLHIFQNVIPVEAYTREAAMINALRLHNLCNVKSGDFYGLCATWPERKKRLLGVYLLYRAMLIFLSEGERQLMPDDIGK